MTEVVPFQELGTPVMTFSSSVCETDYRSLIAHSADQTSLVVVTAFVTDIVKVKKIERWEIKVRGLLFLHDACITYQTN